MKKLISVVLTIVILTLAIPTFAAGDVLTVKLGGKQFKFPDAKPYLLKDGTPMIPITPIAKTLGFSVKIIGAKTVEVKKGSTVTTFNIGDNKAKINGIIKTFDVKTIVKNGRTYVTPQYIRVILSSTCDWFYTSKTIVIYSSEKNEKALYQRLYDSSEYEVNNYKSPYTFGCDLRPKDKSANFIIYINKNYTEIDELDLRVYSYDENTRNKVKEIFTMAYGKLCKDAYKQFIATLREDVHKLPYDILNRPGVIDVYYNNRALLIYKEVFSHKWVDISIGLNAYKYTPSERVTVQAPPAHSSYYLNDIKRYAIYYEK